MGNFNEYQNLIIAICTILGAGVGYLIKYWLDKNKELISENTKIKREMYKKFVSLMIDLFKGSKSSNAEGVVSEEFKNDLYEFYKDYILYSSPRVINSYGDMMQYLYKNENNMQVKKVLRKLSAVMKEMRKELGLSNILLGYKSEKIFRGIFKDFDTLK